jgi:hypothetical protein
LGTDPRLVEAEAPVSLKGYKSSVEVMLIARCACAVLEHAVQSGLMRYRYYDSAVVVLEVTLGIDARNEIE